MADSICILKRLWYAIENESDARVKDWYTVTPMSVIVLIISYILFVTKIGPMIMQKRKPFQLKQVLIVYNLFQVLASAYLFYKVSVSGWMTHYKWFCEPVDYSMAPIALEAINIGWLFLMLKYVEFLDTIFFVLRKKFNQITVLHVFHHSLMAGLSWAIVKLGAGGTLSFAIFPNTFIHIIMYGYYLLAALGPHMQKYLWWKKYITMLQLVQFVAILIHGVPQFFMKDCEFSRDILKIEMFGASVFVILFSNFYRMEYIKRKQQSVNVPTVGKMKSG